MADGKRVEIVGEVKIDQSTAEGSMGEMIGLLKAFKEGFREGIQEIDKAEKEIQSVESETQKASLAAEAWKGIWQGVGQKLFDAAINGIRGLIGSIVDSMEAADDFGDVFSYMAARGIQDTDAMREAAAGLAQDLGVNMVDVAKAMETAFGTTEERVAAAEQALIHAQVTGSDYNETMRTTTQLVRAFNMPASEQAEVIEIVARHARGAKMEFNEFAGAMTRMAPQASRLGISLEEMSKVVEEGLKKGIQPARMGLMGMDEVIRAISEPTKEFTEALAENNLVSTESSGAWRTQSKLLEEMKDEARELNSEIATYQRLATEIGLISDAAQRRIDKYETLQKKQETQGRLDRDERQEMRELEKALKGYNNELAQFDKLADVAHDREFRRMEVTEQLRVRIEKGAEAQKDLQEKSAFAKLELQGLESTLKGTEYQVELLAEKLEVEMPAAILALVGEEGLGGFITRISDSEEAMKLFSGQAQTFITNVAGGVAGAHVALQDTVGPVQTLKEQFNSLAADGENGYNKLVATWGNIKTTLAKPIVEARDNVSTELQKIVTPEDMVALEKKMQDLAGKVGKEARALGSRIVKDIRAGLEEDGPSWGTIMKGWLDDGWAKVEEPLKEGLRKAFKTIATAAWEAFWDELYHQATTASPAGIISAVQKVMQPVTDFLYGNTGLGDILDPAAMAGGGNRLMVPASAVGGAGAVKATPSGATVAAGDSAMKSAAPVQQNTFHISNPDPVAVANEVTKIQRQQMRMGTLGMAGL